MLFTRDVLDENKEKIYSIDYSDGFEDIRGFLTEYDPERSKKACIISDSRVAGHYMTEVAGICSECFAYVTEYVFPEGEASKNLDVVRDIYTKLIQERFTRNDVLIALGGGVTGDMCGYAAATYLRGIDFIQIPTSLLADVDSSIGGKTGVDFDSYKNMVGAFHMPVNVYINISTLDTLSRRQLYSGMGEVVKMALIRGDDGFYEWLQANISRVRSSPLDRDFILKILDFSNKHKSDIVSDDPHETKGLRELLNFGHTLGHAIEKYMNFEMLHGECVSIGCILAGIISRDKGLITDEELASIRSIILDNLEVPSLGADIDVDRIIAYTHNDKKAVGSTIKYILLDHLGNGIIRTDVTDEDMRQAISEYYATCENK